MSANSFSDGFGKSLVDVHSNYRSGHLNHERPDELISDAVTGAVLRPHIVRSGFFFSIVILLSIVSFIGLLLAFAVLAQNPGALISGEVSPTTGLAGFLIWAPNFLTLLVVVAWIIALFIPLREPIAEYGLLIEGRASAHASAYAWIRQTINARRSPFQITAAQEGGVPVLILANRRERGLVIVRPVGADLYMGWTMWRERSTIVVIGNLIRDMFKPAGIASDVRSSATRALRELIHSVTREGVQAAILNPPISEDSARAELHSLPPAGIPGSAPGYGGPSVSQPYNSAHGQAAQWDPAAYPPPSGSPSGQGGHYQP